MVLTPSNMPMSYQPNDYASKGKEHQHCGDCQAHMSNSHSIKIDGEEGGELRRVISTTASPGPLGSIPTASTRPLGCITTRRA